MGVRSVVYSIYLGSTQESGLHSPTLFLTHVSRGREVMSASSSRSLPCLFCAASDIAQSTLRSNTAGYCKPELISKPNEAYRHRASVNGGE
jgi:hypothetical protein